MTIKVGDRLPNVTVRLVTPDGPKPVETKDYFAGKKAVLFGLPGAFTPTCHKNHLPGFIVSEAAFKAKGVDAIAMTSVNDPFVLQAWSDATGAKGHIDFLADGGADFAKALGLDFDASFGDDEVSGPSGFGPAGAIHAPRCQREPALNRRRHSDAT
jgi:peroxiredoxin